MPPVPTARSFIGVAKETTKGTAVAPTDFIPVAGFEPKVNRTQLLDEAWRGSAVDSTGSQQGKAISEIEIAESPLFVDTFGWPCKFIFGEEAVTGSAPVGFTHAFTLLNSGDQQPPAGTFTDMLASIEARAWPGTQLAEMTLMIDPDGNITWSGSGVGFADAAASTPTPSWTGVLPQQGWRISATLNGTAIQAVNIEATFTREVEAILSTSGTQNPFAIWVGKLGVEISGNVVAENNSHITAFAADTQGVFTLTGTRGTGASTETITLTCTKTAYEAVEIDRSNAWVEYALDLKPVGNTTDVGASGGFGPAKLTLVSARSAAY